MKKTWLVLAILILIPAALAQQMPANFFDRQTVTIEVNTSSFIELGPKFPGGTYSFDYMTAKQWFFPKNDASQKIKYLNTTPESEKTEKALLFHWQSPRKKMLWYNTTSVTQVQNDFGKVKSKVAFPIKNVPAEARQYLKETEHTGISAEIRTKANELAKGEDDLWFVASKIGIWVKNNIEYDLSTVTKEVSQNATWVFENKKGVCDELTSLYMAMLRSIGIPARFITGVSYTTELQTRPWGAHGWAEAYFPEIGWIPFDPTYGEFGWIDPAHVKALVADDPGKPSATFEWRGNNAGIKIRKLDIEASVKNVGPKIQPKVKLSVQPLYDEVGFGSYNLVLGEIENLMDYYQTTTVALSNVDEIEITGGQFAEVILRPKEKKDLLWIIQVKQDLREEYTYTIPAAIATIANQTAVARFKATASGEKHSRSEIAKIKKGISKDEKKVYATTLKFECSAEPKEISEGEKTKISCNLQNTGTVQLTDLEICFEGRCKPAELGIGQEKTVEFEQEFTTPGTKSLLINAKGAEIALTEIAKIKMTGVPEVGLSGIRAPKEVKYGEQAILEFSASKLSVDRPKNLRIDILRQNKRLPVFMQQELVAGQNFEVQIDSRELGAGTNKLTVELSYADAQGKRYTKTETVEVKVTDVPFFKRIILWFRDLFS